MGLYLVSFTMNVALLLAWGQSTSPPDQAVTSPQESKPPNEEKKKIFTNEEVSPSQAENRSRPGDSAGAQKATKGSRSHKSSQKNSDSSTALTSYRDLEGHDRAYWQKKIKPLRAKLESIDSQIQSLQEKQSNNTPPNGIRVSRRGRWHVRSRDTAYSASQKIDELKRKKTEVQKSIQGLEEEARKAQALPEWLR